MMSVYYLPRSLDVELTLGNNLVKVVVETVAYAVDVA